MAVNAELVKVSLDAAMKEQLIAKFEYEKADGEYCTRRGIPYEFITSKAGDQLVRCYDIDRGESRSFRLDRFQDDDIEFFHPEWFISKDKWEAISALYFTA